MIAPSRARYRYPQDGFGGRGRALAAVAFALVGFGVLLGRLTAPSDAPPADAPPAEQAGPGPTRLEAGVPVGYARTEAGAVAAATQYVAGPQVKRMLDRQQREAVLELIAAEGVAERLADEMDPGIQIVMEGLGVGPEILNDPDFVARPVVGGYRVLSYDEDEATVEVWNTAVFFALRRHAPPQIWSVTTVDVRWERGDWRLVDFIATDGPNPPDTPTPADPNVGRRINEFREYVHVPAVTAQSGCASRGDALRCLWS